MKDNRRPTTFHDRLADTLCNVAQLLDGWHADGTAWSEWDESVRQQVSQLQGEVELIRGGSVAGGHVPIAKRYLGDGAYADLGDGQLILTTEDGLRTTNRIVLDEVVLQALLKYLEANTKLRFSLAEGVT